MKRDQRLSQLREILTFGNSEQRLVALCSIPPDLIEELIDPIVSLTSHWRAELRIAALEALLPSNSEKIVEVLKHSLRDEERGVRQAAAALFHREKHKQAA